MADNYAHGDSVGAPARRFFAIPPHDTDEVAPLPKALLFCTAGVVTLRAVDSAADETITVFAGQILPVRAQYVRATGTDADGIYGLA